MNNLDYLSGFELVLEEFRSIFDQSNNMNYFQMNSNIKYLSNIEANQKKQSMIKCKI